MTGRLESTGNGGGSGKGLVDVTPICEGCTLFKANAQQPPPEDEMPIALSQVIQKWMLGSPVRVRVALPIVKAGNTIGLFVWYDRAGP
jgi:hypothetical protein